MRSTNAVSRHVFPVIFSKLRRYASVTCFTEGRCADILDIFPDVETLKKVHAKLFADSCLWSKPSLWIKLMRAYAAQGEAKMTRQVFDGITEKNVVFFNVMIRSYVNNGMYSAGILVFKDMPDFGVTPDNYSYPCVLKACAGSCCLHFGLQVHCAAVKVGLDLNLFVGNGLISMYGKCRWVMDAKKVLTEMPKKDVISWNSMVAGYAQSEKFDEALKTCKEMNRWNVKPDCGTMASLHPAVTCTSNDNVLFVETMFRMIKKKSLVSYNVMIAVYTKNEMPNEAVELYRNMEMHGIEPNSMSAASVLPACGNLSALSLGRQIHEFIDKKKLLPNLLLENALIDMYAKCGCLTEARTVFERMEIRDIVSWTSMICAYGISGNGHDAVKLFEDMRNLGLTPDSVAFVSILAACSHSGLLQEGRYIFYMMKQYNISPQPEHFACLVDLLGRAGKINEAYEIIKQMPIEPDEKVWGSLLSACRVHNNMDIGIAAADSLFQLSSEPSGYYVMLSNIYAKAGRWHDVATIRSTMEVKGVKKQAGISNVELHGQVYTFLAGDRRHPLSKQIYAELEVLFGRMKELGYVPETNSALHDVEEEDKESHLAFHSEKLAIVFAIINTSPGTVVRITKNLRVCWDCHVAAKFLSQITQRKIIVRDNHRFHYFVDGACSCGDYW